MTEAQTDHPGPGRWPRLLAAAAVPVAAAALTVFGVLLVAAAPRPESFGWFAYGPMTADAGGPGNPMLVTGPMQIGYLLAALGLLVAAFWCGFRIGRGRPTAPRNTARN